MRIFICARPSAVRAAKQAANELTEAGHEIHSTWLYGERTRGKKSDEERGDEAMADFRDLIKSDCVVVLSHLDGDCKDELFGAGVAFNKRMVLIGKPSSPFHWLPMVDRYASLKDFINDLGSEMP